MSKEEILIGLNSLSIQIAEISDCILHNHIVNGMDPALAHDARLADRIEILIGSVDDFVKRHGIKAYYTIANPRQR
ncbi:MAG: hypothetical protein LBL79_06550 [Prevotella sp.]|jgi:hypothetical protein|nr:hypothetical protein [Prevotella sp.]